MTPTKAIPKKKVRNALAPIRKSNRIADRLAVINSNTDRRHYRHHKASAPKLATKEYELPTLNDDCLLAIFSFLSIMDLFELRKCSRRFRALADAAAPKQCRNEEFHYIYKHKTHEEIVKCYGEFMQNVVFEHNKEIAQLSYIIGAVAPQDKWMWLRQCTSLKTLSIRKILPFYDRYSAKMYENLVNLGLEDCNRGWDQYVLIIKACKNLKTIILTEFTGCSSRMFDSVTVLENIEKISIRHCWIGYDDRLPRELAKLQGLEKLKCLEIHLYNYGNFIATIAKALDKLKNIRLFQIRLDCHPANAFESGEFSNAMKEFEVTINLTAGGYQNHYDIKLLRNS